MRPDLGGAPDRPILYDLTMALSLDLTAAPARAALSPRSGMSEKPPLIGLTRSELAEALVAAGIVPERQAKMRAQQLWHWLYVRGVSDFAEMFNISKLVELKVRISPSPGPRSSRSRFPKTAPANGCSGFPRVAPAVRSRSRPSTSPRKGAAHSASPARSAAR